MRLGDPGSLQLVPGENVKKYFFLTWGSHYVTLSLCPLPRLRFVEEASEHGASGRTIEDDSKAVAAMKTASKNLAASRRRSRRKYSPFTLPGDNASKECPPLPRPQFVEEASEHGASGRTIEDDSIAVAAMKVASKKSAAPSRCSLSNGRH